MRIYKTTFLAFLLHLVICTPTFSQNQKGADINGIAQGDQFGHAVDMPDTNTIAIGAPFGNGPGGSDSGEARVFIWTGNAWQQKGQTLGSNYPEGRFGWAVAMGDANTLAVSAKDANTSLNQEGAVLVYSWNGSMWVPKGNPIAGEGPGDQAGFSISMPDPNTVAIGAPYNLGAGQGSGHVRVFRWNGTAWIQKGMDIDGDAGQELLGYSVAMPDSNTLAVGATFYSSNNLYAGRVRVYEWSGTAWIQKGTDLVGAGYSEQLGTALSMPSSGVLAIGGIGHLVGNQINSGRVRVFEWTGNTWSQIGGDIVGDSADFQIGSAISMPDEENLAIGVHRASPNGNGSGFVRVYRWSGTSWSQRGNDIQGVRADDEAGYSVSMPAVNTVGFGCPENDALGIFAGHAQVFWICAPSASTMMQTSCQPVISPSGNHVWTSTGTYFDTIPNAIGCDSIITVQVTINSVSVSVTNNSPILTANAQSGASFQWMDCNAGFAPISGATGQVFVAPGNGLYAVLATLNGCSDTSSCELVSNVSVPKVEEDLSIRLFPNPTQGCVTIHGDVPLMGARITVRDALGRVVDERVGSNLQRQEFTIGAAPGVYTVMVEIPRHGAMVFKVVKE